jgi:hypothetical protein
MNQIVVDLLPMTLMIPRCRLVTPARELLLALSLGECQRPAYGHPRRIVKARRGKKVALRCETFPGRASPSTTSRQSARVRRWCGMRAEMRAHQPEGRGAAFGKDDAVTAGWSQAG